MLDVIYKIIAKEPTEVVKWVYFCRKNSRKVVNWYHGGTSKIAVEIDNRSQNTKELVNLIRKKEYRSWCYFV